MDRYDEFLRRLLRAEGDLKAFIGSIVRDYHAREDLFQEMASLCWKKFGDYDTSRPFGAWARGIAANLVKKHLSRIQRFPAFLEPGVIEAIAEAFDRTENQAESRLQALRQCMKLLPENSQQVLRQRYSDEKRPAEIAQEGNKTRDSVYKSLMRIRQKLHDCVERRMKGETT
ncbi:MAG: sigma-70 family RNA polymerase sigma factor [Planctomycetota bacterium]|jgi:RNA polymerase sigma-70 factor (ECF subfamily)|nr:sigma-70 family RNA polymerase sigma factor [Planctomycetota bacterium]